MPSLEEQPKITRATVLKEAVHLHNGQQQRVITLLTETIIDLLKRVEELENRSIRTVHKVQL
jgi:hypothetical protein